MLFGVYRPIYLLSLYLATDGRSEFTSSGFISRWFTLAVMVCCVVVTNLVVL